MPLVIPRKTLVLVLIIVFTAVIILPVISSDEPLEKTKGGATLYVGGSGSGNYSSIQSAINAASSGDTIFVYNGTYYENVVVNKTVNLTGEDKEDTIIDGDMKGDTIQLIFKNESIGCWSNYNDENNIENDNSFNALSNFYWLEESIDIYNGRWNDIKIDSNNTPHVCYSNNGLRYAVKNGSSWEIEVVKKKIGVSYESILIDSFDNPHIGYLEDNSRLTYAVKNGSSWDIETIDESYGFSFALDNYNIPHFFYEVSYPGRCIKYAVKNGSSWDIETIFYGAIFHSASLEIDSQNRPHVCFLYETSSTLTLMYGNKTGDDWVFGYFYNRPWTGYVIFLGMVLDSNDNPHIGYYGMTDEYIRYMTKPESSSTWIGERVTDFEIGQSRIIIAVDSNDNPYICFDLYHEYKEQIFFASRSDGRWGVESIGLGRFPSFSLDSHDCPHFTFNANGELKHRYAKRDTFPPSIKIIGLENWVYINNSQFIIFFFPVIIGDFNFLVDSNDNETVVNRVEFLIGNNSVKIDYEPPFEFWWNATKFGAYTIEAIAYDNAGNKNSDKIRFFKLF